MDKPVQIGARVWWVDITNLVKDCNVTRIFS